MLIYIVSGILVVSILTLVFRVTQGKSLSNFVSSLAWLLFGASTGFISFGKVKICLYS